DGAQHLAGVTISAGMLAIGGGSGSSLTVAGPLSIGSQGSLDVGAASLILGGAAGASTDAVRSYLAATYDGGRWDDLGGITSSALAAMNAGTVKAYALGYAAAGERNVLPTIAAGSIL